MQIPLLASVATRIVNSAALSQTKHTNLQGIIVVAVLVQVIGELHPSLLLGHLCQSKYILCVIYIASFKTNKPPTPRHQFGRHGGETGSTTVTGANVPAPGTSILCVLSSFQSQQPSPPQTLPSGAFWSWRYTPTTSANHRYEYNTLCTKQSILRLSF